MSIKIDLTFRTQYDLELLEADINSRIIRLLAKVCFKTNEGLSKEYRAIVDTGAPNSLIPVSIWKSIQYKILSDKEFPLSGIASKDSKPLMAKIARVGYLLLSETTASGLFSAKAYLLATDHVPLILGFEDVLTDSTLFCDYKSNTAYIEV